MGEWLKDLKRAAQETAQREQRGQQMTLGDVPAAEAEAIPGTTAPAAPAAEARPVVVDQRQKPAESGRNRQAARPSADYRRQFRVAYDFLQRYTTTPPAKDDDWTGICDDMTQLAQAGDNDPLLMDMLCAAFEQLERNYNERTTQKGAAL